jgi:hypothetical protein
MLIRDLLVTVAKSYPLPLAEDFTLKRYRASRAT